MQREEKVNPTVTPDEGNWLPFAMEPDGGMLELCLEPGEGIKQLVPGVINLYILTNRSVYQFRLISGHA